MKIAAPIIALAALALIHAAPVDDAKQLQPMERREAGALSESFIEAAVSKRHDAPAVSLAGFKKRDDDNDDGDNGGDNCGDDGDDGDDGGDDGGGYGEGNPLVKRGHGGHRRRCRRVCYKRCWDGHDGHDKRADEGEVKTTGQKKKSYCRYYCYWRCYGHGHH